MRGKATGKSNYENYRWLPELTLPMAKCLMWFLDIEPGESLLEIGCARGYMVRALRENDVRAFGYDISEWAIQHCDETVIPHVSTTLDDQRDYDYIYAKDCFEHIDAVTLGEMLVKLLPRLKQSMLVIVPLTEIHGGKFVREEDDMDATHINRWPLQSWIAFLQMVVQDSTDEKFLVSGYYYIPGLKPTSMNPRTSCGFILVERI